MQTFDTVEDLRVAPLEFREIYNATWLIERHGSRPPAAIRNPPPHGWLRHLSADAVRGEVTMTTETMGLRLCSDDPQSFSREAAP